MIQAAGNGSYSCCGILLPQLEADVDDEGHAMQAEVADGDCYITVEHEMSKTHYISFWLTSRQTMYVPEESVAKASRELCIY